METIEINERSVAWQLGQDNWAQFGQLIAQCWSPRQVMIVTDETVGKRYLTDLVAQLRTQGFWVGTLILPSQAPLKGLAMAERLASNFEQAQLGSQDGIIALGGGQVLDVVGAASGLYRGGLPLIQIPTTLTAQSMLAFRQQAVLNVNQAVNRLQIRREPTAVLIDVALLASLNDADLAAGYANLVALAALAGGDFFNRLQKIKTIADVRQQALVLLQAAWTYQSQVVVGKTDLEAQVLTFGQVFADALSTLTGGRFRYGETLAIGMVALLDRFSQQGYTAPSTTEQVVDLLTKVQLPVFATEIGEPAFVDALIAAAGPVERRISLVGLAKIGQPIIVTKGVQKVATLILGTAPDEE